MTSFIDAGRHIRNMIENKSTDDETKVESFDTKRVSENKSSCPIEKTEVEKRRWTKRQKSSRISRRARRPPEVQGENPQTQTQTVHRLSRTNCPHCGTQVAKTNLSRHTKTDACRQMRQSGLEARPRITTQERSVPATTVTGANGME